MKKYLKKPIILGLLATFCLSITLFEYFHHKLAQGPYPAQINTVLLESLKKSIAQEETRVWKVIEEHGVAKEAVFKQANAFNRSELRNDPAYKDLKAPNAGVKKFVEDTLRSINIDPATVLILSREQPFPACNVGDMILVNERLFLKHSPAARRFIIIHESGHMVQNDGIVKHTITTMLDPKMNDVELATKYPNHPLCQYLRLMEWRADVFALTHADNIAQGYGTFCSENIAWWGEKFNIPTHPSYGQRLQLAQLTQQYPEVA